jgi:hypothetical protein
MWSRIFPQLQCKKFQSPIRIYTDQCEYEPELARHPFIFETDDNCCQVLENTGHSFQVSGKGHSRMLIDMFALLDLSRIDLFEHV